MLLAWISVFSFCSASIKSVPCASLATLDFHSIIQPETISNVFQSEFFGFRFLYFRLHFVKNVLLTVAMAFPRRPPSRTHMTTNYCCCCCCCRNSLLFVVSIVVITVFVYAAFFAFFVCFFSFFVFVFVIAFWLHLLVSYVCCWLCYCYCCS